MTSRMSKMQLWASISYRVDQVDARSSANWRLSADMQLNLGTATACRLHCLDGVQEVGGSRLGAALLRSKLQSESCYQERRLRAYGTSVSRSGVLG